MTPIQPILILGLAGMAVVCFISARFQLASRLLVLGFALLGTVFVLRPDLTNAIAHSLGVGRGADLVFYLFFVTSAYLLLRLYAKTRALDRQITQLARSLALAQAAPPGAAHPHPGETA